jgi:transposase
MPRTVNEEARAKARALLASGLTTRQIAAQLGVSQRTAARWTAGTRAPGRRPRADVTDEALTSVLDGGASYGQASAAFGVSKSTVWRRVNP